MTPEGIRKKSTKKENRYESSKEENVCFVITPIGKVGTGDYEKFKEVLEYIIKPAVKNSDYKLRVIRADDIERAGSLIKDILEYIFESYVVIADLTGQNPNVFYELGVRHSLSPRTILIAQSLDDIPSDLRDYKTIIYDVSAKGASLFQERLVRYLIEIYTEPGRPDNPVLDRLGSLVENRTEDLEKEIASLKNQLDSIMRKGSSVKKIDKVESAQDRMERILRLKNAERQWLMDGSFTRGEGQEKKSYSMPVEQGDFNLYFLKKDNTIVDFWYVDIIRGALNFEKELANIRVLMERCSQGQNVECSFIIATNEDLSSKIEKMYEDFDKIKSFVKKEYQKYFKLEVWDANGLLKEEKKLGLKV